MRCRGRWASSRGPATLRTRAKASRWSPSNGTTSRTPTSSRSGSSWPAWPRSVSGSPSSSPAPRADLRDRARGRAGLSRRPPPCLCRGRVFPVDGARPASSPRRQPGGVGAGRARLGGREPGRARSRSPGRGKSRVPRAPGSPGPAFGAPVCPAPAAPQRPGAPAPGFPVGRGAFDALREKTSLRVGAGVMFCSQCRRQNSATQN